MKVTHIASLAAHTRGPRFERLLGQETVGAGDHQVQVIVNPTLLAEQGINPPATVHPHLDAAAGEPVEDLRHIVGGGRMAHRGMLAAWPGRVDVIVDGKPI